MFTRQAEHSVPYRHDFLCLTSKLKNNEAAGFLIFKLCDYLVACVTGISQKHPYSSSLNSRVRQVLEPPVLYQYRLISFFQPR